MSTIDTAHVRLQHTFRTSYGAEMDNVCQFCWPFSVEGSPTEHNCKVISYMDEIDALRAKVAAVEALHRPVTHMVLAWECDGEVNFNADCEHESDCPLVPLVVCGHCDEIREIADDLASCENTVWPCATARAISAAISGPVDDA